MLNVFNKVNRHILSFNFFKSAVLCLIMGAALFWGYKTDNYQGVFPFVIGVVLAYFPNAEGSQRHRIIGIVLGFFWSFFMLLVQLLLFQMPQVVHFSVMLFMVFVTSMLAVYGHRGGSISFGGLFAIVSSYGIYALKLPHVESVLFVLYGGLAYIVLSAVTQFFYQGHHIQSLLADCVELTAKYFKKLDEQIWADRGEESELLQITSQINHSHELLRSALLNKGGWITSSNKSRRQYLIFRELVDLFELTLGAGHDLAEARNYFSPEDAVIKPYREFTRLLIKELESLGVNMHLNRQFVRSPEVREKLFEVEDTVKPVLYSRRKAAEELVLQNLIDLKIKQFNRLNVICKHYDNLKVTDTVAVKPDARFITAQDYSFKGLWVNLNFKSSIFRHAIRLSLAIAICFLLEDLINAENTSWIIATCIVVLRPNYGLTRSRAYDRIAGTILGGLISLGILYFTDYNPVLIAVAAISLTLGFSYVASRYLLASMYISLSILMLYAVFTNEGVSLVVDRVFYTFIGALIALLATYFILPVWEKESISSAIGQTIEANEAYLAAVNEIYETKEPINERFKLIRKEAFVHNGNLYEAFQRLKDDPKSKRSQLSNSYALVLLSHSMLKGIAAYSAYIQNHKTTSMSGDFMTVMNYVQGLLREASVTLTSKNKSTLKPVEPQQAMENLDKYYYRLEKQQETQIEQKSDGNQEDTATRLHEGKMIIDQVKALKSLAENTFQMSTMLTSPKRS